MLERLSVQALISVRPESTFFPDGYTRSFLIRKPKLLRKFKENKKLRGGVLGYAAQAIPKVDTEIPHKGRFRMETNYALNKIQSSIVNIIKMHQKIRTSDKFSNTSHAESF